MKLERKKARVLIGVTLVIVGIALIIAGSDIRVLKNPISSMTTTVYHLLGQDEIELGNLRQGEVVRCDATPDEGSFNVWIENKDGEIVSELSETPADHVRGPGRRRVFSCPFGPIRYIQSGCQDLSGTMMEKSRGM